MVKNQTVNQKKDKKITIMHTTSTENDMGDSIEVTEPIPGGNNIWAYYRQASANEFYSAASTSYKVEAIFRIRWIKGLDTHMKILFRGEEYGITRIDDFEGYKQDLTIYAYVIIH